MKDLLRKLRVFTPTALSKSKKEIEREGERSDRDVVGNVGRPGGEDKTKAKNKLKFRINKPASDKDEMKKAKGLPIGTIRDWSGVKYRKEGQNKWMPVREGKQHHQAFGQDTGGGSGGGGKKPHSDTKGIPRYDMLSEDHQKDIAKKLKEAMASAKDNNRQGDVKLGQYWKDVAEVLSGYKSGMAGEAGMWQIRNLASKGDDSGHTRAAKMILEIAEKHHSKGTAFSSEGKKPNTNDIYTDVHHSIYDKYKKEMNERFKQGPTVGFNDITDNAVSDYMSEIKSRNFSDEQLAAMERNFKTTSQIHSKEWERKRNREDRFQSIINEAGYQAVSNIREGKDEDKAKKASKSLLAHKWALSKGKKLPIGTIREWKGKQWKKVGERKWAPMPKKAAGQGAGDKTSKADKHVKNMLKIYDGEIKKPATTSSGKDMGEESKHHLAMAHVLTYLRSHTNNNAIREHAMKLFNQARKALEEDKQPAASAPKNQMIWWEHQDDPFEDSGNISALKDFGIKVKKDRDYDDSDIIGYSLSGGGKTASVSWQENDPEGAEKELDRALKTFGLHMTSHPNFEGSNAIGYIISPRKLSGDEIKKIADEDKYEHEGAQTEPKANEQDVKDSKAEMKKLKDAHGTSYSKEDIFSKKKGKEKQTKPGKYYGVHFDNSDNIVLAGHEGKPNDKVGVVIKVKAASEEEAERKAVRKFIKDHGSIKNKKGKLASRIDDWHD